MWYLVPVLLIAAVLAGSVVLGYVVGGRLRGFERLRLRWWPLALAGLALQVIPVPDLGGDSEHALALGLLIASYALLLAFALANIRLSGFPLVLAGLALNLLVISVNGGMPVSERAILRSGQAEALERIREDGGRKHHLADEDEDALLFLADVIPVGAPFRQVVSAGDLVLYAGVAWLVVTVMRGRPRWPSPTERPEAPAEPPSPIPPGATTSGTGP